MSRNESLILIKELPSATVSALDSVLADQGMIRTATRTINVDWTPLIYDQSGPLGFVLSAPQDDWLACWTSLNLDGEWAVAENLAAALGQEVACVVFGGERGIYAYRYWADGMLRAEALPGDSGSMLDEAGLLHELELHGIPLALIDDRIDNFTTEHLVLGYVADSAPQVRLEDSEGTAPQLTSDNE